jgi:hypothetical protein
VSEKELFKLMERLSVAIDLLEQQWRQPLNMAEGLAMMMLKDSREIVRNEYKRVAESEARG